MKIMLYKTKTRALGCLTLACALAAAVAAADEGQTAAKVDRDLGLQTTRFDTLHGAVVVMTPTLVQGGDRISGTVTLDPVGKTETERGKNLSLLQGAVLTVLGSRVSAGKSSFSAVVPNAGSDAVIALLGESDKVVSQASVPILPKGSFPLATVATGPGSFKIPPMTLHGRPMSLTGPFDGDASNTACKVNGADAALLAETPREAIFLSTGGSPGAQNVQLREQGWLQTGQTQSLQIALSADKTQLVRGEKANVVAKVRGFKGAPSSFFPIPFILVNESPGTVRMQGGNSLARTIRIGDVSPEGEFTLKTTVTAQQAGNYTINGQIAFPGPGGAFLARWDGRNDDDDWPIPMDDKETVGDLRNYSVRRLMDTLRALRDAKRYDYVNKKESQKWLGEKIRLVKQALKGKGVDVEDLPIDDPDF